MTTTDEARTALRWPWKVTITYKDGSTRTDHDADDFDPMGYAEFMSNQQNVARVEVSAAFVAGAKVSPDSPGVRADDVHHPVSAAASGLSSPVNLVALTTADHETPEENER